MNMTLEQLRNKLLSLIVVPWTNWRSTVQEVDKVLGILLTRQAAELRKQENKE